MPQPCAQHPDRTADAFCQKCGKWTCALCKVDIDGSVFCSVLCFTEESVDTKRRIREQEVAEAAPQEPEAVPEPAPAAPEPSASPRDPLAGVGLDASSSQVPAAMRDDDSVVLPAQDGQ